MSEDSCRPNTKFGTQWQGERSEAKALARLVEVGYDLSLPFGGKLRYDFVADDGTNLHRVQVKTGHLKPTGVLFTCRNPDTLRGSRHASRGYEGAADVFVVYCPELDEVYWVPISLIPSRSTVCLRITPYAKPGNNQLWASDFVLSSTTLGSPALKRRGRTSHDLSAPGLFVAEPPTDA